MRIPLLLLPLLLASCSYLHVPLLSPYKMDIRQGNVVSPEMLEKLKYGMTRVQVRHVLGTPLITDAFHGNRWDYIYRLARDGDLIEERKLAVYFENDLLVRVEEDGKPVLTAPPPPPVEEAPAVPADPAAAVHDSVRAWAAAWSGKNLHDYLAAYAPDYAPPRMSREAWEKQRLDRISRPKIIEVVLNDIEVAMQDDSHATATFRQDYRSDHYRDSVRKTLKLEKSGNAWLIVGEQAEK